MSDRNQMVIKKYSNRRLYNTRTSKYITQDDLAEYVRSDVEFKVINVKTGEDVTRVTLVQVILDRELSGYILMPIDFIKVLIKFYDHPMIKFFMESTAKNAQMFNELINNSAIDPLDLNAANFDWTGQFNKIYEFNRTLFDMFMKNKK